MRHKKPEKRWSAIFLAAVMAMGMFLQPLSAYAGSASDSNIKNDALTLADANRDQDMEISAEVKEDASAPSYTVSIPSLISLGSLSTEEDNELEYSIYVAITGSEGYITVSSDETGVLYNGDNTLAYTNTFGTQIINLAEVDQDTSKVALSGTIIIKAGDVAKAAAGNYTGVPTFSITYSADEPGNPDEEDGLSAGKYTVDVSLWNATSDVLSMGNSALDPQAEIVVGEDGTMTLQLSLQSLDISGITGYLYYLKKVDMDTVEYNQYKYPAHYETIDAEILEYYTGIYDAYNNPSSPSYDPSTEGNLYPKIISIPIQQDEDMFYVEIHIPVMESIGAGQGTQIARLHIDWDSVQKVSDDSENGGNGSGDTGNGSGDTGNSGNGSGDTGNSGNGSGDTGNSGNGSGNTGNSGNTIPDIRNLADGVYSITGNVVKVDKTTLSMADNAINHTVKLTVKDGKYYITLNLKGLTISEKLGYLSQLKYFTTGYTVDEYGNPAGNLADVTVDSYQMNADGTLVSDSYGTNYPDLVTFELIPEALEDGYVPLQIFVPVMEAIAAGTGTQPVYLALDWSTIARATEDDPEFTDGDDNNSGSGNSSADDNNSGANNGSGLSGGASLGGGAALNGGSTLGSGTGLNSNSSGLSGSGLGSTSSVKTGDTHRTTALVIIILAMAALITGVVIKRRRLTRQ